ncbi:transcription elongation factor S-II [Halteromyces radiatus]|uniref:transcription elongation factor S-II n=1 Tax=Halteromyces radiatus TaxID=101107 RepID=UPI00221EF4B1|nr:transcription elongation factor S-II [Halteromyces radiatus]KAI8089003.1 transcription elongation factor S-II [Halteromyces radiatus]
MSAEHDLLKTKRALQKATENDNTQDILDIMNQLAMVKATQDLLKKTDIGKVLGKLRSHSDAKVSQRAKGIVKKWKDDVVNAGVIPSRKSSVASQPSQSSSPTSSPPKTPTTQLPSNNGPPRTIKSDEMVFKSTGNTPRDKTIELMYNSLALDSFADSELLLKRAIAIERTVFTNIGQVDSEYKTKIRSLSLNLKSKSNPGLRESTVSGELSIVKLCTMSVEDMASEESKARDRKLAEEALFKARGAGTAQAETDMFICGKCKQRKCTYFQMQTRSADEPMTTFVTCLSCNNRWKFC